MTIKPEQIAAVGALMEDMERCANHPGWILCEEHGCNAYKAGYNMAADIAMAAIKNALMDYGSLGAGFHVSRMVLLDLDKFMYGEKQSGPVEIPVSRCPGECEDHYMEMGD